MINRRKMTKDERLADRIKRNPSFAKRAYKTIKETKEIVQSGKVSRYDYNIRMALCRKCEFFTKLMRCKKCGCFMNAKARYKAASCPINKWDKIKGDEDGKKKND
jgi:predicted Zn-ribbon and HTH transcriptional regulator